MNPFLELHDFCIANRISIATAESCTAGRIASEISAISGASLFFNGGLIAYQNNIKVKLLGVSELVIKEKTEVSAEVVEQMAEGVRDRFLADFAISTSGYAGPSGGTILNPVGTVLIGISSNNKTVSQRFLFKGDRQSIINQCVITACRFLLQELKKQK